MNEINKAQLIIISGPSGAGKSTLIRRLLDECPFPLRMSVSATTRPPREGEQDGVDYHFLSQEEFTRRQEAGDFLEYKEVFGQGDWYGTLASEVSTSLSSGKWVILEIDVEGMLAVIDQFSEAITLFVWPGSMEELEVRLRARGTDSENSIQRRIEVATRELKFKDRYRFEIINDEIDRTVQEICNTLKRCKEESDAG